MSDDSPSPRRDELHLEDDADLGLIKDRLVAVLGYGSQGHAQAQNLRDSGISVIIGNVEDSFAEQARNDGFEVMSISEAVERAEILLFLFPDEVQGQVYAADIEPHLREGQVLNFASGYSVHFGIVRPPEFVDVVLTVPTCVGAIFRERFARGDGTFGHFGVHQDYSGNARGIALALAKGIGLLRFGASETTMGDEVAVNLFAETSGLSAIPTLLLAAYEVLIEAGFSAEQAYAETFYELQFFAESLSRMPLGQALTFGSPTAAYLGLTQTGTIIDEGVKDRMRQMLRRVQSGELVREWNLEQLAGKPVFTQLRRETQEHSIKDVEEIFFARKEATGW